jgi:transcriptional regulator with XRE-family HTH domain
VTELSRDQATAKRIGVRIAEARRAAGLTQTELADEIGLRLWHIERFETSGSVPPAKLREIAAATGRPLSWLEDQALEDPEAAASPREAPRPPDVSQRAAKLEHDRARLMDGPERQPGEYEFAIGSGTDNDQTMAPPPSKKGEDSSGGAATGNSLWSDEESLKSVLSKHNDAKARVELDKRFAEVREREKAITEALVVASRVRVESEREGKELKVKYAREAESMKVEAKRKAEETVRAAEAAAEEILEDARAKARGFEQEIRDAEQLTAQTRARLTSFLESLLAEIERYGADLGPPADDLLARAGDAVKG